MNNKLSALAILFNIISIFSSEDSDRTISFASSIAGTKPSVSYSLPLHNCRTEIKWEANEEGYKPGNLKLPCESAANILHRMASDPNAPKLKSMLLERTINGMFPVLFSEVHFAYKPEECLTAAQALAFLKDFSNRSLNFNELIKLSQNNSSTRIP